MKYLALLTLCCLLVVGVKSSPAQNEDEKPSENLIVEGRGIGDTMKGVWDFFFGGDDDYDYADYSENEFNPSSAVSSYTWYDPNSARRESSSNDVADNEDEYSWGEIAFGAALAVVPIGLLLAAFPAGLFTVAVKKRSFGDDNLLDRINPLELPLLKSLQEGDLLSMVRPQCQKKLFCEISQLGKDDSASFLQRTFYFISHLMPEPLSRRLRLQRLFDATRQNQCQKFTCETSPKESPSNHLKAPSKDDDLE